MLKAIASGKEHRKPYRGAKAVDASCRNHGDDPWSKDDRLHADRRREPLPYDEEPAKTKTKGR